jgi:tetratricopeptide (TPR) repeat protein
MDLRGLAALFGKINALLSEPGAAEETESLDLFGLSRFLQRRGEPDRAHSACSQALEIGLPAEFLPKARRELALMAKRRGEHDRAAEIWQEIVADPQDGIYACEQLAIHFERHAKNLSRAAELAQLGLAKLRCQRSASRDSYLAARSTQREQKFLHRIARLRHQMQISDDLATPLALSHSTGEPEAKSRYRPR